MCPENGSLGIERRYTPSMVGIQKMVPAAHVLKMASRPWPQQGCRKIPAGLAADHDFPHETSPFWMPFWGTQLYPTPHVRCLWMANVFQLLPGSASGDCHPTKQRNDAWASGRSHAPMATGPHGNWWFPM